MRLSRTGICFAALIAATPAIAQEAILQGGPWTPGHLAQYVGQGFSQPIAIDAGNAGGGGLGANPNELGLVIRSPTGVYPATSGATGPFNSPFCTYDAPITNATGYHFLCLSPNSNGGGVISYGAGGLAAAQPLSLNLNGATYPFPFTISGVLGPTTTAVGDLALWNNTAGTLLKDQPVGTGVISALSAALNGTGGLLGVGGSTTGLNFIGLGTGAATLTLDSHLKGQCLELTDYTGADPTGATFSDVGLASLQAAEVATLKCGHATAGTYKFQSQTFFDVSKVKSSGLKIYGDGCNATVFTYTGASAPAFRIGADTATAGYALSLNGGAASGGTGYASGGTANYFNVPLTGGSGSGATGTVFVTAGVITAINATNFGTGYMVGDQLSVSNSNVGGTGSGVVALVRGDNFYSIIKGINFVGNAPGPLMQYGRNDMLDPLNGLETDNCENNNSTNAAAEQMRVNGVITSPYFANTASGPGPTIGHSAWEVRGAAMVNFYGSASGMAIGMHFTATNSQSVFGNTIHAIDSEVDGINLQIDNSGGGTAPQANKWLNGQYAYSICAINATAGAFNSIDTGNLGGVNDYCSGGKVGIRATAPIYDPLTLNTWEDLGVNATNGIITIPQTTTSAGLNMFAGNKSFLIENVANGTGYLINGATGLPINYQVTSTGSHQFFTGATLVGQIGAAGVNSALGYQVNGGTIINAALPTITSGFGTSPSITAPSGSAAFRIVVGTGGAANTGVIAMNASAPNGWTCKATDTGAPATFDTKQFGQSSSAVTLNNYNTTTGAAAAWNAGDVLLIQCNEF